MHSRVTLYPLTNAQIVLDWPLLANIPSLYTEHEILWYGILLWPVQVRCPGSVPSQLPVDLLTARTWEAEKSLKSTT